MRKWYLFFLPLLAIFISGCLGQAPDDKVKKPSSWLELNIEQLNAKIEKVLAENQQWPLSPLEITTNLFGGDQETAEVSIQEKKESGENPSNASIVYIRDGFLDDSVRGDWYEISFKRKADGSWRINSARAAYRCWRGGNVDTYQGEFCP